MTGQQLTLDASEALLFTNDASFSGNTAQIGSETLHILQQLDVLSPYQSNQVSMVQLSLRVCRFRFYATSADFTVPLQARTPSLKCAFIWTRRMTALFKRPLLLLCLNTHHLKRFTASMPALRSPKLEQHVWKLFVSGLCFWAACF